MMGQGNKSAKQGDKSAELRRKSARQRSTREACQTPVRRRFPAGGRARYSRRSRAARGTSGGNQWAVIVAVVAVRVMKMAGYAIIHVVAMRNRLVTAARAVHMARLVTAAVMVGGAAVGVFTRYLDHVLVHVVFVRVMEVAIMQIVDMATVADGRMTAGRSVLMCMVAVGSGRANRHRFISFFVS